MISNFISEPRASYLEIRVGWFSDITQNAVCYYYEDTMPSGTKLSWTCTTPLYGRYVSVQKIAGVANTALSFCEIEVFQANGRWFILRHIMICLYLSTECSKFMNRG